MNQEAKTQVNVEKDDQGIRAWVHSFKRSPNLGDQPGRRGEKAGAKCGFVGEEEAGDNQGRADGVILGTAIYSQDIAKDRRATGRSQKAQCWMNKKSTR
jgi:hypothetical protein